MTKNKSHVSDCWLARLQEIHHSSPVQIQMSQVEGFATVLSQAFHNEPRVAYILPEEVTRRSVLPWFFRSIAIRASQFGGKSTQRQHETAYSLDQSRTSVNLCTNSADPDAGFEIQIAAVKLQALDQPVPIWKASIDGWQTAHWYLAALGVRSLNTVNAISGALIEPVLSRPTEIAFCAMSRSSMKAFCLSM